MRRRMRPRQKGQPVAIGNLERFIADFRATERPARPAPHRPPPARAWPSSAAVPPVSPPRATSSRKAIASASLRRFTSSAACSSTAFPSFACPSHRQSRKSTTCAAWASSLKPTSSSAKASPRRAHARRGLRRGLCRHRRGSAQFLGIPGEHFNGVYSANEFLTRTNLMRAYDAELRPAHLRLPRSRRDRVGGGNTAMDAVRTARRLGARTATLVYRRSEVEMPARREEVHHAREEGIEFRMLTNPIEFIGDEKGWLTGARCQRMELGEPDADGRRRPVPIPARSSCCPPTWPSSASAPPPTRSSRAPRPTSKPTSATTSSPTRNHAHLQARRLRRRRHRHRLGATVILAMGAGRKAAKVNRRVSQKNGRQSSHPCRRPVPGLSLKALAVVLNLVYCKSLVTSCCT
jgi:glutamate synthase (NADPH) small chain